MKEPEKRERINVVGNKTTTKQVQEPTEYVWTANGKTILMKDMTQKEREKAYQTLAKKAIKMAASLNKMQEVLRQLDTVSRNAGHTVQLDVVL